MNQTKLEFTNDMKLLKKHMNDGDTVRSDICSNKKITPEILELMYDKETSKDVIINILNNPNVTNRILWSEYKKYDFYTIPYVLINKNIPIELITEILLDNTSSNYTLFKSLLISNESLPKEIFFKMLNNDNDINIKLGAIYNKHITTEKMVSYYQSNNNYLKQMICKSKYLTKEVYDLILNDLDDYKIELSKNNHIDLYRIGILYKDKNKEIRNNITLNKKTPLHILIEMRDTDSELLIQKNSSSAIDLFHSSGTSEDSITSENTEVTDNTTNTKLNN